MSHPLALADALPPPLEKLGERLLAAVGDGREQNLTADELLGISQGQLAALMAGPGLALRYVAGEWPVFDYLRMNNVHRERAIVFVPTARATNSTSIRVTELLRTALADLGLYGSLITTDQPDSPIWQQTPEGWITILAPSEQRLSGQRIGLCGLRLAVIADQAPGPDWQDLADDNGLLLGWTRGRQIALRFHPFLSRQGRLTAANSEARAALIAHVLRASKTQLMDIVSDDEAPAHLGEWAAAIGLAQALIIAVRTQLQRTNQECSDISSAYQQAEREVAQLRQALQVAESRMEQATASLGQIEILRGVAAARAHQSLGDLRQQLDALEQLPQIASVELTDLARHLGRGHAVPGFVVTTCPLVLDCGSYGLRNIGPITIHLLINDSSDPQIAPTGNRPGHPAVLSSQTLDWGNASVPLAEALGQGNFAQAMRLVIAALGQRSDSETAARFPAASAGASAGFLLPE